MSLRLQHAWSTVLSLAGFSTPLPCFQGFVPEIHVRPFAAVVTVLLMSAALFLGFNASTGQYLPLHSDKFLHFVAFAAMSFGSCWTFYIPNRISRSIWYREHFSLLLNLSGWSAASIISEVLQGLLPSKTFQYGDILANLAGTLVGLWAAYQTQGVHRQHLELSALYLPLEAENSTAS